MLRIAIISLLLAGCTAQKVVTKECVLRPYMLPDEVMSTMKNGDLIEYYTYLKTYDELCQ